MTSYAQFYAIARTAHVERAIENQTRLFYVRQNYDFDEALASSTSLVTRTTVWRLVRDLRSYEVATLEINEPLMLPSWRYTVPALLLLGGRSRRKGLRIVSYAIENLSPVRRFKTVTHLPESVAALLVRFVSSWIYSHLDLIVFGTEGSQSLYKQIVRDGPGRTQRLLIPALPRAQVLNMESKLARSFVFLGDLSARKGFDLVCEAWPLFAEAHPDAALTILGKGALDARARDLASRNHRVSFISDPSRAQIRDVLARSENAILPSITSPDWREQVGLPIVEAWSFGCRVLTSDATGIRDSLASAGHIVRSEPLTVGTIVAMLETAVQMRPTVSTILDSLPAQDGRTSAWEAMRGVRA